MGAFVEGTSILLNYFIVGKVCLVSFRANHIFYIYFYGKV